MSSRNHQKKRTLVTGSSGLIGRWVCRTLLENEFDVVGLDRVKCAENLLASFYQVDILNQKVVRDVFHESQPDSIIHLAARTDLDEKKELKGYAANIDGVRYLLETVRECESVKRVIVTSSQLVCRVGHVPCNDREYCPNTLYGKSKVLTEQITREMDGGGKEWCLTRPTTVWGPGMGRHYQKMLHLIEKGRFFHCGKNRLYKSYAYAGNIAFQYLQLLLAPREAIHGRLFYLADYEPLSLHEYINALAAALGAPRVPTIPCVLAKGLAISGDMVNKLGFSDFPFNSFRLRNILSEYQFNLAPTREVCGDTPYSFADGIRATAEWWKNLCRADQGTW